LPGAPAKTIFSRDGKRVAALSWNWWAGVWERDTGRLVRLIPIPRGQFADNADLTFSPDGRRLAVSGGNTATLWDLETGDARRWTLPWALTEALAFQAPDRLLLFRTETRDGSRPPDSEAPPDHYPRVCVLRDLLSPTPIKPLKVITDFNWFVQDIEAAPDGRCFVIQGKIGPGKPQLHRSARAYGPNGDLLRELLMEPGDDNWSGWSHLDPTGKLLALNLSPGRQRPVLLEVPSGRFLGPALLNFHGVSPGARLWAREDDWHDLHLCDRAGNRLVELPREPLMCSHIPFSPDLDGRYILLGNQSGLVSVADLVELQRRLAEIGMGW
jgi:hypothetical protein